MKFTLIDHDQPSIPETPYNNRAILQFEDHAAAQEAFTVLENGLSFEANRIQFILGRSIVITRLTDKEYKKMLRILEQANVTVN